MIQEFLLDGGKGRKELNKSDEETNAVHKLSMFSDR